MEGLPELMSGPLRCRMCCDCEVDKSTPLMRHALKALSSRHKISRPGGLAVAIPFFKRAIELANFAVPYAFLSITYTTIGEPDIAQRLHPESF